MSSSRGFFSAESTRSEQVSYYILASTTVLYAVIVLGCQLGPLYPTCHLPKRDPPLPYHNLDYHANPCHNVRYIRLLGLTTFECDICTRILTSIALGTVIGFERSLHGQSATGMRTMSILCLGACCFCIASVFAFIDGPMSWDASRSSAAIPTGVGFLGGATIWKGAPAGGSSDRQEIHGLTSAILVWMTAAVGNALGGALYVPAVYTTLLSITILNFVPDHMTGVAATGPMAKRSRSQEKRPRKSFGEFAPHFDRSDLVHLMLNLAAIIIAVYAVVAAAAPWLAPECDLPPSTKKYTNVDFAATFDSCSYVRYWQLGGLSKWDADMCTRLTVSVAFGALIGWERRRADRAVGLRSMAIVCLASSLYTFGGIFCEITGPSTWDSARVASSVVSGVSFIGGASIIKGSDKHPQVHGLTTATSVWLSAALGLLAGGAMYAIGFFSSVTAVFYLRFGPRTHEAEPNEGRLGLDNTESEGPKLQS